MAIFMYNVGKRVIYIYIIVHLFKNEWVYKDYEDVYDKKKIWALDPSIDTEYLYTLLKNWKQ